MVVLLVLMVLMGLAILGETCVVILEDLRSQLPEIFFP
jgi:uncharacterized protein with HEPN domain